MVSLPTPRCVLIRLEISSRVASTGTTVKPVANAKLVERIQIERVAGGDDQGAVERRIGKRASRWMNFEESRGAG